MVSLAPKIPIAPKGTWKGMVILCPLCFLHVYQRVNCMLTSLATWFRYIIKRVDPKQSTYSWSEMSFYTKWSPFSSVILCFDVPKTSQMRTHQALASSQQRLDLKDIYAGHAMVLDEVLALFDESVWALRDEVRRIEKVLLSVFLCQMIMLGLMKTARVETQSLDRIRTILFCTTLHGTLSIQLKLWALH